MFLRCLFAPSVSQEKNEEKTFQQGEFPSVSENSLLNFLTRFTREKSKKSDRKSILRQFQKKAQNLSADPFSQFDFHQFGFFTRAHGKRNVKMVKSRPLKAS